MVFPAPRGLTQHNENLLPREADAHGENSDAPLLELLGGQGHMPLGPPVGDDDEDLGHRGISAPRESFAQKVFQSKACLCAPSSELTQKEKKKGERVSDPGVKLE